VVKRTIPNKALQDLTRKYEVAYAAYQSSARAVISAGRNAGRAPAALLLKEERALVRLTRARARLLAEMALISKPR
jgi:hypothetical protein